MNDKTTPEKIVLDACCGGRWFWFNKNHPNTLYIDNRRYEKGHDKYRKNHSVEPDIVMDFREMDFPDKKFKLVVFDPPHMKTLGKNSKFARYYGCLNAESWQTDLRQGFQECWRVLDDFGVLVFKWNESEISLKDILKLFPQEPLFGHPTNSKNTTHWCCFMKIPIANPDRHLIWANFTIPSKKFINERKHNKIVTRKKNQTVYGFNIAKYNLEKEWIPLRNCVQPELGLHIFNSAYKETEQKLLSVSHKSHTLASPTFPTEKAINKDLEVSASPTPKVCPQCHKEMYKHWKSNTWLCDDCCIGEEGKPSLNPDIKRNNQPNLNSPFLSLGHQINKMEERKWQT